MVSPKVPGSCPIRKTVLDDQAHGYRNYTVRVAAAGHGEVRHVGVEVLLAARTEMLRVLDEQIHGSFRSEIANVVEDSLLQSVPIPGLITARAGTALEVTTTFDDLRLGQIFDVADPLCWIRSVLAGCGHFSSLQARNFFSPEEIGPNRPSP